MNYFEIFGLPVSYTISPQALKTSYYKLSKERHPDRFASDPDLQGEMEYEYGVINEAYETLRNDNRRLTYLVNLLELFDPEDNYPLDQEFLMEMLELNELKEQNPEAAYEQIEKISYEQDMEVQDLLTAETLTDLSTIDKERLKSYYYKKQYINRLQQPEV